MLPWNEVARRLHLLVHNNQYLDENNKQGYEKWEAEQQAKRDARQAEIDYAEKTIADFCEREGLGEPDFRTLRTSTLPIPPLGTANTKFRCTPTSCAMRLCIRLMVPLWTVRASTTQGRLPRKALRTLNFRSSLTMRKQRMKHIRSAKPKPVEKRPLAAGDTVYLENDHPFTVEEIGIFDVHLRDEDFL